jgi:hypothetical protein
VCVEGEQAVALRDLDACVPVSWEFWEWAVAGGVGEPKSGGAERRRGGQVASGIFGV